MPGKSYGKLTVVSFSGMRSKHRYYLCKCDCGAELDVRDTSLASGKKTSCAKCAAAKRKIGTYKNGYRVVDYLRSEATSYIVECIVCRNRTTVPSTKLRSLLPCECQLHRKEIIDTGVVDEDLLTQLL